METSEKVLEKQNEPNVKIVNDNANEKVKTPETLVATKDAIIKEMEKEVLKMKVDKASLTTELDRYKKILPKMAAELKQLKGQK